MTQDLANKLIAHYEGVIEQVKGMDRMVSINDLLRTTGTGCGICKCASEMFGECIYSDIWVESFGGSFWHEKPYHCTTKTEILEALQFRVDRLKTFKA